MTTEIRFDYSTLADDQATTTRAHADRIRELVKLTTESAIEIGRRLLDVRGTLEPRAFHAWLKAEFRWDKSTAWKFMASAEHFGHLDCLDRFDRSALYELSMTNVPDEAREQAIALARKGEHVTRGRSRLILREHGCGPTRRDAGKPRKQHPQRGRATTSNPNALPSEVVSELRSTLEAFGDRIDEWQSELGEDVRLDLANVFLELAMKLQRGRIEKKVARKRTKSRKKATAAA